MKDYGKKKWTNTKRAYRWRNRYILGNSGRHSLERGNKLASHQTVYRQVRQGLGLSAG